MLPWVVPILAWLPADPGKFPRALMLRGQAGLGKRTTACFLAKAILCESTRAFVEACGECPSCQLVTSGSHPDLRLIETGADDVDAEAAEDPDESMPAKKAGRRILVDQIRAMTDFIWIATHRGRAKVIVICPAEAMHPSAANAVLKMLEEPPFDTYFLLVSHRPDRVLPTIRSRCVQIQFTPPTPEMGTEWLRKSGAGEAVEVALALAGYAPLSALEKLTNEGFWAGRKALLDMLVAPGFDPLSASDRAEQIEGPELARLLAQWIFDLTALKSGGSERYHLDYRAELKSLARKLETSELILWYEAVLEYGRTSLHPLNRRLALESLFSAYPASK